MITSKGVYKLKISEVLPTFFLTRFGVAPHKAAVRKGGICLLSHDGKHRQGIEGSISLCQL